MLWQKVWGTKSFKDLLCSCKALSDSLKLLSPPKQSHRLTGLLAIPISKVLRFSEDWIFSLVGACAVKAMISLPIIISQDLLLFGTSSVWSRGDDGAALRAHQLSKVGRLFDFSNTKKGRWLQGADPQVFCQGGGHSRLLGQRRPQHFEIHVWALGRYTDRW